ncbi:MAG TPA: AraC family transcriptional regulator [Lachnospiraceae bacterium]|nr:AraC family transcriptional regulator [Lachnospiraceae bacterium]
MGQPKKLLTTEELGEDLVISSRTSKFYPVSGYHSVPDVKGNLLYLSLYGEINAVFPFCYDIKESDSFWIIYTKEGKGKLTAANNSVFLTENTVLFFSGAYAHTLELYDSTKWDFHVLNLNGHALPFYYRTFLTAAPTGSKPELCLSDNLLPVDSAGSIPSLFKQLSALNGTVQKNGGFNHPFTVSLLLTELLTVLIAEKGKNHTNHADIPSYLRTLKNDLDHQYMEPCSLKLLEEKYKICKYTIVHDFSEHFGTSPIRYLIGRRICAAREQLTGTDLPINRIASSVGIENMNHFIYLFKKETGMTPSAYRKNMKGAP